MVIMPHIISSTIQQNTTQLRRGQFDHSLWPATSFVFGATSYALCKAGIYSTSDWVAREANMHGVHFGARTLSTRPGNAPPEPPGVLTLVLVLPGNAEVDAGDLGAAAGAGAGASAGRAAQHIARLSR